MGISAAFHRTAAFPRSGGPISRRQIEALVSRAVAVFGVLFCVQALPVMIEQAREVHPLWSVLFVPVLYAAIVLAFAAAILRRFVRVTQGAVAVIYVVGIATWPLAITGVVGVGNSTSWLYLLLTIATAMATIAFPVVIATAYLILVPVVMATVRVLSGAVTAPDAALHGIYSVILGGSVVLIVTMLRQAATSVDRAQAAALQTYGIAVRQHATDAERVLVDAIVHDGVLTTLLAAARSETPRTRALAAAMATDAIGQLRRAALVTPLYGTTTRLSRLSERITEAAGSMGAPFQVHSRPVGPGAVPSAVADAVYSAAVQAMVNSVQHAGSSNRVRRWVTVHDHLGTGIEVEVGDTGSGFEPGAASLERLGVRVSILERVASVGGEARIQTAPGEGTVASIRWPGAS